MNRYTIIVDDKRVAVDDIGYDGLVFTIDPTIHAVQWYGSYGEIEYSPVFDYTTKNITKPQNEIFDDVGRFASALDAWNTADTAAKEAAAAALLLAEAPKET